MPEIVPLAAGHEPAWRQLFAGYCRFYQRELTDDHAARVWGWLLDPGHPLEGLVALVDRAPVGLAHYRAMPSPVRGAEVGFLDDLFVAPSARGHKVGEALIEAVAEIARRRGWGVVRWITADDNYRARQLYDRLAKKTLWNLYELAP